MLLVAFGVARVFEEDLGGTRLYLALQNSIPEFLSFYLSLK